MRIDAQQSLKNALDKDVGCSTKTQKDNKTFNQPTTSQIAAISINNNILPAQNEKTSDNKKNHGYGKTIEEKTLDTNQWMVGVGILQLIVFIFQGWILLITIRGEKLSKRPYIFITVKGGVNNVATNRFDYKVTLKNHGQTTAIIKSVNIICDFRIVKTPISPIDDGIIVIAPGEDKLFDIWRIFDEREINAIEGVNKIVYCFGRIGYKDIFGVTHYTKFCWEYQPRDGAKTFYPSKNRNWNKYT